MMDDDIAYIVENDLLLNAINAELATAKNLKINYGSKVAAYVLPTEEDPKPLSYVKMSNGDVYTCELLVSGMKHTFIYP